MSDRSSSGGGRRPTVSAADEARARAALALLDRRALSSNRARMDEIESVVRDAVAGVYVRSDRVRSAANAAHKVAGSAGSFGMREVSELARDLEGFLTHGSLTDAPALRGAIAALEEIQRQLRERRARDAAADAARQEAGLILVAHPDRELAASIAQVAQLRGWATRWAADAAATRESMLREAPDVVAIGPGLQSSTALSLLDSEPGGRLACVTVVLGGGDGFDERVAAARAGADGYLPADTAPETIVDVAIDIADQDATGTGRVLALTADPGTAASLREHLETAPVDVTTVDDEQAFWAALASTRPHVVLIDATLAAPAGADLCQRVRADLRWATVPLVLLLPSATLSPDVVEEAFAAGVDDYVTTPIVDVELRTRILGRLDRLRAQRRNARTDALTGLVNRPTFETAFARLAGEAHRVGSPLSLALVAVDGFRGLNEQHDRGLGDVILGRLSSLLSTTFTGDEIVARWGWHEIAIAMPRTRRTDGVTRLVQVLDSFNREEFDVGGGTTIHASCTVAVGEYGVDAPTLRSLVRSLSSTMATATRAGGMRVVPVGWHPDAVASAPDVLIVEDDETLASLLQHAIETRRLRIEHIQDGQVALDRLTGPDKITPRVILLDVELPGLNGLEVLRRIEAEGVLARSRVIMLTVHAEASEVAAAMRHGAFDHVAKPFSLPALMQRLRRALDAPR